MTDRDRLIELLLKCDKENDVLSCFHERPRKKQSAEIIADYLIANGVIVPPCKVGDMVYTSYDHLSHRETNEIFECKVVFIGLCEDGNYINLKDNYGHLHSMDFETFGKTVFLTREEAEKALERSKGNE